MDAIRRDHVSLVFLKDCFSPLSPSKSMSTCLLQKVDWDGPYVSLTLSEYAGIRLIILRTLHSLNYTQVHLPKQANTMEKEALWRNVPRATNCPGWSCEIMVFFSFFKWITSQSWNEFLKSLNLCVNLSPNIFIHNINFSGHWLKTWELSFHFSPFPYQVMFVISSLLFHFLGHYLTVSLIASS